MMVDLKCSFKWWFKPALFIHFIFGGKDFDRMNAKQKKFFMKGIVTHAKVAV